MAFSKSSGLDAGTNNLLRILYATLSVKAGTLMATD
jgi:hypothetical protein